MSLGKQTKMGDENNRNSEILNLWVPKIIWENSQDIILRGEIQFWKGEKDGYTILISVLYWALRCYLSNNSRGHQLTIVVTNWNYTLKPHFLHKSINWAAPRKQKQEDWRLQVSLSPTESLKQTGWRDGSVGRSTSCSFRGPGLDPSTLKVPKNNQF